MLIEKNSIRQTLLVNQIKNHNDFCNEDIHRIPTNGPNGQNIQYFVCDKFCMKTPKDRFSILNRRGYYIQCLYSGSMQDEGKNVEDKFQHDFVCEYKIHEKFSVKKDILA